MKKLSDLENKPLYYWYKGEKQYLVLNPNKHFVLFTNIERADLEIFANEIQDGDVREFKLDRSLIQDQHIEDTKWYWSIINNINLSDQSLLDYYAPFFWGENGKEVGLSHLFYVKLYKEQDLKILEKLASDYKVKILGYNQFMPRWYTLSCDKKSMGNSLEVANLFYETGYFEHSQPDLMEQNLLRCVNDTYFSDQWGIHNTGQYGGLLGSDIKGCNAWALTKGCNDIVVAVLDQGIETNHPDLTNISNISFDAQSGTSPSQIRGDHGVAVAGIIGAQSNNGIGISGIAPEVALMSISHGLTLGPNVTQQLANGLNFAWVNGAHVINNSWGHDALQSAFIDDAIEQAIEYGRDGKGTLVVFATGNDNNASISYPASNPNTIAVGAASMCNERKSPDSCDGENWGSNYGTGLDVVAPGVLISTTDRLGNYGYNPNTPIHPLNGGTLVTSDYTNNDYTRWFNGTSAACPHVSGIVALVLSINSDLTHQQIRRLISDTAQKIGSYTYANGTGAYPDLSWNNEMGYGLINAYAAVQAALPPIAGPSTLCDSGFYTIEGLPVGASVIAWSADPSYAVSISGGGNSITVAKVGSYNGNITLKATVNANCVVVDVEKTVYIGVKEVHIAGPYDPANNAIVNMICSGREYYFIAEEVSPPTEAGTTYTWVLIPPPESGLFPTLYSGQQVTIDQFDTEGGYQLELRKNNVCGTLTIRKQLTVHSCF